MTNPMPDNRGFAEFVKLVFTETERHTSKNILDRALEVSVCVCVRACVRACVRVCVCLCFVSPFTLHSSR